MTETTTEKTLLTPKNSTLMRLSLYIKSVDVIKDHPVTGLGYGGIRAGYIPYISDVQALSKHSDEFYYFQLHSDFLQQILETGVISGILFLAFFMVIVYTGFNALNHAKTSEKDIFIYSLSSGLLVNLLHAFISFPFYMSTSNLLIYLSAGFILSTKAKKIFFKPDFKIKLLSINLFILLFVIFISSTVFNIKHIKSSKLLRDSFIALYKNKNCNKAIQLIDESNQLFEFDFQAQLSQALIYDNCPQHFAKQRLTLEKLITLNPTNFKARFLHGNLELLDHNPELAFKDFSYLADMLPMSALGYIGLGNWAINLNKIDDARLYYKKALSLSPGNKNLIRVLEQINEND